MLLLSTLALLLLPPSAAQRGSDPTTFNGGSVLAMAGRSSVAIAIDSRFGLGMQTISAGGGGTDGTAGEGNPRIVRLPNSDTLLAWTGLYGDGMGFAEETSALLARKVRRAGGMGFQRGATNGSGGDGRKMSPPAIASLVSHLLYRRRSAPYYVEPVVVGLESVRVPVVASESSELMLQADSSRELQLQSIIQASSLDTDQEVIPLQNERNVGKQELYKTIRRPYLCGTDMLGAKSASQSFVCSGVASRSLHGTAEALWRPDLEGDELVQVCGRAFVSALERDCLSGYGAVVYLIQAVKCEDDGREDVRILEYVLACRND